MKHQWLTVLLRQFTFSSERALAKKTVYQLSPSEKVIIGVLFLVLIISTLFLLQRVNRAFLSEVPSTGGSLHEGVVGFPRFINPVLATSNADKDLTLLVYSGLMRAHPEGHHIPDLADTMTISDDGLVYTFVLKDELTFHDGEPLTTADVAYTVSLAQDPALNSPERANWEGVLVEVINDKEIKFILSEPYSPFLENTAIGILPKHLWEGVSSDQFPFNPSNIQAVGSGPFKIDSLSRNGSGVPDYFVLESFNNFALGEPHIRTLRFSFFNNEKERTDAYDAGSIGSAGGVSPNSLSEKQFKSISETPLPRIFAVFLNQNNAPIFAYEEVREALNAAIDREHLIATIFEGYGSPLSGPFPPGIVTSETLNQATTTEGYTNRAKAILENAGWEENVDGVYENEDGEPFSFTLITSNAEELKQAAEEVEQMWENIGARVELQLFESSILNQNIIRPREYQSLLFGEVVGRELDLFAFWHSSQRNDPGLNVALYANITADAVLEDARESNDRSERVALYNEFQKEIETDIPAIFLYAPHYLYLLPNHIHNANPITIAHGSERFLDVHNWYVDTEFVWDFFIH